LTTAQNFCYRIWFSLTWTLRFHLFHSRFIPYLRLYYSLHSDYQTTRFYCLLSRASYKSLTGKSIKIVLWMKFLWEERVIRMIIIRQRSPLLFIRINKNQSDFEWFQRDQINHDRWKFTCWGQNYVFKFFIKTNSFLWQRKFL